ncbi:bluetail domain-containing putative surface protein [Castellaniella defragrans]|uniref:bluetail domain-containing putative surface protein n=1 Tax=Castellaniella defragrans TaxID=75697 RepID=UPI0023F2EB60|nr:bluetail domain-containing putative surface protein [Castellaniella defragrans]
MENRDTIVGGGVTVHASQGIATFSGIVDETDLAGRITAAFQVLGSSSSGNALAFVFEGDTYLAVERGGDSSYQAGTDLVIQLTGVTDLTALGSAAADHTLVLQAA